MKQQHFSIAKSLKSFTYAFNGLKILIREERNSKVHLCAAFFALTLGFVLGITKLEWIAICFAISMVFILELINTAIENMADFISPEKNDTIKKIKDLAAAAVLIGSITSLATGTLVFLPKLLLLVLH
jgi:diacylglycerol kinase